LRQLKANREPKAEENDPKAVQCRKLELTRFRGHLNVRFGGVHDGREEDGPVHTGV
jgi:hypothetical protein